LRPIGIQQNILFFAVCTPTSKLSDAGVRFTPPQLAATLTLCIVESLLRRRRCWYYRGNRNNFEVIKLLCTTSYFVHQSDATRCDILHIHDRSGIADRAVRKRRSGVSFEDLCTEQYVISESGNCGLAERSLIAGFVLAEI